jgi:AGZA family xanthine/uracil permease-like MFS transporter
MRALQLLFKLDERGTTPARELRGGLATFLTMAYILVANPAILVSAGVPGEAAVAATALAAGLCSIAMGLGANFPLALAPGMGINALVAFQIAPIVGSWQTAMGLVVLDGLVVLGLALLGLREAVMQAIPADLRRAIGVGIGLFIAFIGTVNARLVVVPASTAAAVTRDPTTVLPPVTSGELAAAEPIIALAGLLTMAYLLHRRVTGALVIGIVVATILAALLNLVRVPSGALIRLPTLDTLFQANVREAMDPRFAALLLSLVMIDFFDTVGTVTGIAEASGLSDANGQIPGLRRILAIDAVSASVGGTFGASSVTAYVESAAGVAEGARTGLHSVVVGGLFLMAAFAAPLVTLVPSAATAPALIVVGSLMVRQITRIEFHSWSTAIPAFLILLMIPLTYSISHGIGLGVIAYVLIKFADRRFADIHPLMYAAAAAFAVHLFWI